jgi:tRNA1(Val) A37 N6-methylase TrmN6
MGRTVTEGRVSKDALFGGRVTLFQPAHGAGYRANVDAILLAAFAADGGRRSWLAIDLGAGVGAVGLTLFFLQVAERIQFVEKTSFWRSSAGATYKAEPMGRPGGRSDLRPRRVARQRGARHRARLTLVVANPPYVAPERDGRSPRIWVGGRTPRRTPRQTRPFRSRRGAVLGRRGRACFVHPAHALLELTTLARQSGARTEAPPLRARQSQNGRLVPIASLVEAYQRNPGVAS